MILISLFLAPRARADLKEYDTKYYIIYTDLDAQDEKEAAIRMTRMAEEYHERTKSFAGVIHTKFPFYLFKSREDYLNAGGLPGSAGVFISIGSGGKLMAVAGEHTGLSTWHVVQHEGFHQFAHAVIGGEIPTWLNEGLAEYFGESIFTGDGFVTGVVPKWREQRLKDEMTAGQLKPVSAIMAESPQLWAHEMNIKNYDQAWSMVHFLVYGDDGKYQEAFSQCIRGISRGTPFDRAWLDTLGPANGFEQRWKAWWMAQPPSPTHVLYSKAAVATMTSFVARAYVQKQTFGSFDEFKSAVADDRLRVSTEDWLPPSLIEDAMRNYGEAPGWEISTAQNKQPMVTLTIEDGTRLTGSFVLRGLMVDKVNVDVDDMAKVLKAAQDLADAGKKDQAREMVQAALREHPKSVLVGEAKKFLQSLRNTRPNVDD